MFHGQDSDGKGYSTRAHLAELIGMIGPPPADLLERGRRSPEFFGKDGRFSVFDQAIYISNKSPGTWIADVAIEQTSLEQSEEILNGENKRLFLEFMRGMIQWRPEDRKTAKELLQDPWLQMGS